MAQHSSNLESFGDFVSQLEKKTSVFGPDVVVNLQERERYTKDFSKLRSQQSHLVFIWDWRLKRNGNCNELLKDYDYNYYVGEGYSGTHNYICLETLNGLHIAPFTANHMSQNDKGHLFGEVFAVSPETILCLDRYYQNGVQYNREERNIFLSQQRLPGHDHKFQGISSRAFIYLGNKDHFDKYLTRKRTRHSIDSVRKMCWMT